MGKIHYPSYAIFALILLWICSYMPAGAQTGAATIQGVARDSSAIVPAARVHLTHTATAQVFHTVSNEVGRYTIPALSIGAHRLRVEANGLRTWEADRIARARQDLWSTAPKYIRNEFPVRAGDE